MKKITTLLLSVVMCLSFVACGNNTKEDSANRSNETSNVQTDNKKLEAEKAVIGTWERVSEDGEVSAITFYDDHTVAFGSEKKDTDRANWKYDEELGCYMIINPNYRPDKLMVVYYCTIVNDNGSVFLNYNSYQYFPKENNK